MAIGTVLAVVGFLLGQLTASRKRKSDKVLAAEADAIVAVKERDQRIDLLERQVERLEAQSEAQTKAAIPITAAMQAMLVHRLTNDHTPEADALLKKVTDDSLSVHDAVEFAEAMKRRSTDMNVSEAQRISADILPGVIRLREIAEEEEPECKVKTVMVTVPETETKAARDGGTQEEEKGN